MKKEKVKMTSRDIQALERRSQILKAAETLFAQKGYNETTTRMLCREINMADGLIYHYFPQGKLEILETIINENFYTKTRQIYKGLKNMDPNVPIREALQALAGIFMGNAMKDTNLLVILIRERNNLPDQHIHKLRKELRGIIVRIIRILQNAVKKKEIAEMDYAMMVNQLWGSISFYFIQKSIFGSSDLLQMEPDTYFNAMIEHTLKTWRI